ncbi:putative leucine-rich repeat-containing protein DDB_G0290503 [Chelonus insularis]|uniref:putative leucine-rich repeat-containing protein DDB_G0290503 n=1 Tax=Chelonus insularis TaxID=460826 RepID=UPI00158923BC|nr:putative leucine-rich repeat-containing protein DDB_G0290503 [Chelonus insularis]
MNNNEKSVNSSNIVNSSDEAAIINSLSKYLSNEADFLTTKSNKYDVFFENDHLSVDVSNAKNLPVKVDKLNLNNTEANAEKIYTSLQTVEFANQNVEELNTSKESEDFEELVNLEDVKNIEELESFKESQNFEESIDLEEIKNIEQSETLEVSQNFEETVNFEDIKNIEGSVIIELDDVELSQIQNSSPQKCPYLVIEIPSQKVEDEKGNEDNGKSDSIHNNTNSTENNKDEITFTLQNLETSSESENDQNSSNLILQLSNNQSYVNFRERVKKRKRKIRKKVNTTEIRNDEFKVEDQTVKSINDDKSEITFIRPITPDKLHTTKKLCIDDNSSEHDFLLSSPRLSVVQTNLTDEKKMKFNTSQDIINNSDNEFEQICNFIKNGSYDPAQLSMDTLELLNEFTDFDQSTNEKLLADLINSPMRVSDQIQEECKKVSTPEIEQDIRDAFGICLNSKEINDDEPNIPEPLEDQIKHDNFVEIANDVNAERQSESDNEKVSSSYEDDDSSYHDDGSSSHDDDSSCSEIETSSEIDLEDLREKDRKVKKSLVIKKEVRKKLANFTVKLKHEVPPQHMLEKTIRMPLSHHIRSLFEKHTPMKKGTFTANEDKIIKENWEYFCKVHKWDSADVKPFLQFRYKRKRMIKQEEAINFARFMARGLPSRSLFSVIARFRRLFRDTSRNLSKSERCPYTAKEDKIIMAYLEDKEIDHRDEIIRLAKLLDRPCESVYYRCQRLRQKKGREMFLSKKNIRKHVDWDIPLAEKFLTKLMKLTLSDDVEELKNVLIPPIVWRKLEKKMKISIDCLKSFWFNRLHAQLFYERPFFLNDIKVLLIEYMYAKGITDREEIDWSEIGELFDGIPISYLMNVFYSMERYCNSKIKSDLGDIIDWLYKHRINRIKIAKSEKYLPGVIYKDGKIEIFHRSYPTVEDCDTNNSSEDIC